MEAKMKKYLVLISLELKKMKEYFLNVIMMISTLPVQIMIYIFMIYWLNEYQKLGEFKFSFFIMYYISILILKSIKIGGYFTSRRPSCPHRKRAREDIYRQPNRFPMFFRQSSSGTDIHIRFQG